MTVDRCDFSEIVACTTCGAEFLTHTAYDGKPLPNIRRRYCTRKCMRVAELLERPRSGPDPHESRHCPECDKPFAIGTAWNKRFCGQQCRRRFHKREENGLLRRERGLKYTWGIVTCGGCGIEFDNRSPYVEGKRPTVPRRFCSLYCRKRVDVGKDRVRRLARHGLTVDQYDMMLTDQGGVCAACGSPETNRNWKTGEPLPLHIDHDHESGNVRSLLCSACNTVLGLVCESPDRLVALASYLETWQAHAERAPASEMVER